MNGIQLLSFVAKVDEMEAIKDFEIMADELYSFRYKYGDYKIQANVFIGIYSLFKRTNEIKKTNFLTKKFFRYFIVLYNKFILNYKSLSDDQIKLLRENYVPRDVLYDIYLKLLDYEFDTSTLQSIDNIGIDNITNLIDRWETKAIEDLLVFSNKIKEPQIIYDMYYSPHKEYHDKLMFYNTGDEISNIVIVNEIIFYYVRDLVQAKQIEKKELYRYTYKLLAGYIFHKHGFDNKFVKMFVDDIDWLMDLIRTRLDDTRTKL